MRFLKMCFSYRWFRIFGMIVISLMVTYWLVGANLGSKWWIIDDHEIVENIGVKNRLAVSDYWFKLYGSEAFKPGVAPRYRPIYYAIRISEMVLWGKNIYLWYLTRLLMLSFVTLVSWYLFSRFTGIFMGFMFVVSMLGLSLWQEVGLRLGPSEIYAAVGLCIFCFGYYRILTFGQSRKNWIILGVGTILSVGSKENMVVLILPWLALWLYFFWKRICVGMRGKIVSLVSLAFIFLIGWSVARVSLQNGSDIYQQSTTVNSRLGLVLVGLKSYVADWRVSLPWLAAIFIFVWLVYQERSYKKIMGNFWFSVMLLFLPVIWVSQFVFYNGNWPIGNRYDFPGVVVGTVGWLFLLAVLRKIVVAKNRPDLFLFINIFFLVLVAVNISRGGLTRLQKASSDYRLKTNLFTDRLEALVNMGKSNPSTRVLVISANPWDYEPIVSLVQFLRAYGVSNSFQVKPLFCDQAAKGKMDSFLLSSVCGWSEMGEGNLIDRYVEGNTESICVTFRHIAASNGCKFVTDLPAN